MKKQFLLLIMFMSLFTSNIKSVEVKKSHFQLMAFVVLSGMAAIDYKHTAIWEEDKNASKFHRIGWFNGLLVGAGVTALIHAALDKYFAK